MDKTETTPCTISVVEDDDEFLVRIPPIYRERAKKIAGRQWDPQKRAWAYEKTYYNYRQLYDEFYEDAVEFGLTEPPRAEAEPSTPVSPKNTPNKQLDVTEFEKDIKGLQSSLNSLLELVDEQRGLIREQSNQIENLREDLKSKNESEPATAISAQHCDQFLREMFKSGIGDSAEINRLLTRYNFFTERLTVLNRLEEYTKKNLRSFLDIDAEERLTLNILIREAFESDAITPYTRGLLDSFRRQRNSIVHDDEMHVTKYVRYVFALSALSLAWSDISLKE